MKTFMVFTVALIAVEALFIKDEWNNYKIKYGKSYKDKEEENHRYSIFQSNLLIVASHNKKFENGETTFKMGVNKFADLTPTEFLAKMTNPFAWTTPSRVEQTKFDDVMEGDIPEAIDWKEKGAVTAVKDQGNCGSCWSFSVTGTVEGQNFIGSGKLISLSEQQLVDCATGQYNCDGCEGGYMNDALEYIEDNGIMLEDSYPYEAIDDRCRYNSSQVALKISSYVSIKEGDENDLKKAVALKGPISIGIDATMNMQMYESGVLDDPICQNMFLNHGVLAVGYGSLEGKEYWIVKNSWGSDWGQDGYIWMSRNADNQCGIASMAVYPVL